MAARLPIDLRRTAFGCLGNSAGNFLVDTARSSALRHPLARDLTDHCLLAVHAVASAAWLLHVADKILRRSDQGFRCLEHHSGIDFVECRFPCANAAVHCRLAFHSSASCICKIYFLAGSAPRRIPGASVVFAEASVCFEPAGHKTSEIAEFADYSSFS